jgi:7-keto-8-aminopelargonate synthetase-like enzyme
MSRLRATVTAAHNPSDIEHAMDVIYQAGKAMGMVK